MGFILDIHTFIWFVNGELLPLGVVKKLRKVNNKCFISIASIWEIAIKTSLGKLSLKSDFNNIADFLYANQIDILPVNFGHLQRLLVLPKHHNDPFDRLITAQNITGDLEILTKDEKFKLYDVAVKWEWLYHQSSLPGSVG